MLRSIFLILSGNAVASLMGFARNLLVARLLGVEDYGIASTFAVSMSLIEMGTQIGLQQVIVQAREGDEPGFQAGLHGFNLLRSVAAAAVLFLLAGPIARFIGVPDLVWAYQLLALVPLLRGITHYDLHRLTRQRVYGPMMIYRAVPILISLIAVWPLAHVFGDYQVMLYALLVQVFLGVIVSHLMARRRYGLSFDRAVIGHAFRFGWPLLLNNILLFGVMQGDKVIVAGELGLEVLAIFSMGLTLTMAPIGVIVQSLSLFFLPRLSQAQDDPARFAHLARAAMQASLAAGLLLVLGVALIGGPVVHLLLGEKYAPLIPLLIWFALWQAVRGFKSGGSLAALAQGRTKLPVLSNIVRMFLLPVAWLAAVNGATPMQIVWIATIGEFGAYVTALLLLRAWLAVDLRAMAIPFMTIAIFLSVAVGQAHSLSGQPVATPVGLLALCLVTFAALAGMRDLRRYVPLFLRAAGWAKKETER